MLSFFFFLYISLFSPYTDPFLCRLCVINAFAGCALEDLAEDRRLIKWINRKLFPFPLALFTLASASLSLCIIRHFNRMKRREISPYLQHTHCALYETCKVGQVFREISLASNTWHSERSVWVLAIWKLSVAWQKPLSSPRNDAAE